MSSLPGAAGDLSPVMVPVAPAMLAGGLQSSPWQVAVVRVDETPAGESSGREYPCATQSRHRLIDLYELADDLPHTVVGGGPAGPEVTEPLALLVHNNADPAGQHSVTQNTVVKTGPDVMEPLELLVLDRSNPAGQNSDVEMGLAGPAITEPLELLVLDTADTMRWLEHPLARPESSLRDGLVEKIGRGAGGTSGSGYYPGQSTYGGDSLNGASGSGGGGGGVPRQWTHGGDCVSGTIGAVDSSFTVDCATSGMCYKGRISVGTGVESGY